jgi:chromate transporter
LLLIALVAGAAQLAGAHFALTLAAAGLAYVLVGRGRNAPALLAGISLLLLPLAWANANLILSIAFPELSLGLSLAPTSTLALFFSGLKAGLLTFGGAYTVIPFLQNDAVVVGAWMTNAQFLDGLALAGILPAPLVIFGTFVGFVGGGFLGAAALTAGIYLPAFGFTLIGHDLMEKLIGMQSLHRFLEGVTAGVIGLIAATSLSLFFSAVTDVPTLFIFVLSLVLLYRWSAKAAVAFVVLGAGLLGMLLF